MDLTTCIVNISERDIGVCYVKDKELVHISIGEAGYKLTGTVWFNENKAVIVEPDPSQQYLGTVKNILRYPGRTIDEIYDNVDLEKSFINVRLLDNGDELCFIVNELYTIPVKNVFSQLLQYVAHLVFSYHHSFHRLVVCVPRHYSKAEFEIIGNSFKKLNLVPTIVHDYVAIVARIIQSEQYSNSMPYYAVIHSKFYSTDYLIINVQKTSNTCVLSVLKSQELSNISIFAFKQHISALLRQKVEAQRSKIGLSGTIAINLEDDFWIKSKRKSIVYKIAMFDRGVTNYISLKTNYLDAEMFLRQSGYASLFLTNRMLDACGIDLNRTDIVVAGSLLQTEDFLADRNIFALEDRIKVLDAEDYLFWGSMDLLALNLLEEENSTSLPANIWFYSSSKGSKLLLEKGVLLPSSSGFAFTPTLKAGVCAPSSAEKPLSKASMKFALLRCDESGEEGRQAVLDGKGKVIFNGAFQLDLGKEDVSNVLYMHLTVTKNFLVDFSVNHLAKNEVLFEQKQAPLFGSSVWQQTLHTLLTTRSSSIT